jgi:hypothetical protein
MLSARIPLIHQLPDFIVIYEFSAIGGRQALLNFAEDQPS